jgi:Shwachman-Bodian-Diamond syndrome (SBDS) protein
MFFIDKTLPLVDVVQGYDIFLGDTGGHTGQLLRASQQSLENAFGKGIKEIDILQKILQDGLIEQFHGTRSMKEQGAHVTRGHSLTVR